MDLATTLAGVILVVLVFLDMFHSLLHPRGRGALSHRVLSGIWKASHATGHRFGSAVGPAGMVAVVLLWMVLIGVGWALVYAPHVPDGFTYSPGIEPGRYPDFTQALYVSFVNLTTLGLGDMVPTDPWIRLATPLQALTGFALLTAALTWFTQVYPPLSRRRTLALNLNALAQSGYARALPTLEPTAVSRTLEALADQVNKTTVDLTQNTEIYYFTDQSAEMSLPRQLSYAVTLRDAARACPAAQLHLSAQMLDHALARLAGTLKEFGHSGDDLSTVFAAYASDHFRSRG